MKNAENKYKGNFKIESLIKYRWLMDNGITKIIKLRKDSPSNFSKKNIFFFFMLKNLLNSLIYY